MEVILPLIDRRRAELQRDAFALGQSIYGERPRDFVARLGAYWRAWRAEAEAAGSSRRDGSGIALGRPLMVPPVCFGVVHRLDDGSEWEQVGSVKEYVYRERPGCRNVREHEAALDRRGRDQRGGGGLAVLGEAVGGGGGGGV